MGGLENLSYANISRSHLIASQRKRRYSSEEPLQVTTPPSKWPGKRNFRITYFIYLCTLFSFHNIRIF